jgi:hypothetical protein
LLKYCDLNQFSVKAEAILCVFGVPMSIFGTSLIHNLR